MTELLQRILPTVQKPARYTGGEFNEIQKDPASVRVYVAFCFPDTYEIGMSNVGMRILYGVMNEMEGVWCQRVFHPWGDMEAKMREHQLPLCALLGAGFVTLCDTLSRCLFAPYELPVGILLASLGAPFLLFVLLNRKGGHRHA